MRFVRPASLLVAWALLVPGGVAAQEPPDTVQVQVPDSLVAGGDSLLELGDSLVVPSDSLVVPGDSLTTPADSLQQAPDSLAISVDTFPDFPDGVSVGYAQAVWEWDRDALLSTRAITLAELVSLAPGINLLRGGDYGSPNTVVAFGAAGGGVRLFWDGFEMWPMDSGVPDLSRVGLAGLDRVRVERRMGALRIEIFSRQPLDPEPFTQVEVGTGDLRTNLLRGTFANPHTLGGALTVALDRLDTRGPGLEEVGSVSGVTLRYGIHKGNRGGLVGEMRRYSPKIDVEGLPAEGTRSDVVLRGRWRFGESLTLDGVYGTSSLSTRADLDGNVEFDESRSQFGLRASLERGGFWGNAGGRLLGGDGLPDWSAEAVVGRTWLGRGAVEAGWQQDNWDGEGASVVRASARSESFYGLSLFGSYEDGTWGVSDVFGFQAFQALTEVLDTVSTPDPNAAPLEPPTLRLTERTVIRLGGSYEWRGMRVSGAWLSLEVDSLYPLGLPLDRTGVTVAGGERTGYEIAALIPAPWTGLSLEGAYQTWDEDFPYMPKTTWNAALKYHNVFKETGNLELWADLGVINRDPMVIPLTETPEGEVEPILTTVPEYKEWYLMIQVRVVSVRIFVRFENLATKRDNFDYPGRIQPATRSMYGIRWIMFN